MFVSDVRHALRGLWHAKGFTVVALLCLGFGIGLNTTIFSVVDGVLLKPFPYEDPDRIVVLRAVNDQQDVGDGGVSYPDFDDLRKSATSFASFAGLQFWSIALSDPGAEPERFSGGAISWDLFPMLGVAPALGRGFTPDMDRPGAAGVVLISHAVWRDRYRSDRQVLGRSVRVNGQPATIIGVMPEYFEFPQNQKAWIPLAPLAANAARDARNLNVFARLKPGVSVTTATADLVARGRDLSRTYPATHGHWTYRLASLREEFIPPDVTLVLWIMMASVTLVLFIACSNVANLQLSRAAGRRREFSLRASLGAGRGRIIRQLLTESVVLSVLSLPLGLVLAQVGTRLIASAMPADQVPYYVTWAVDWRSLVYAAAVAVATAVLFGALPAIQTSRGNLVDALKEGTRGNSVRRSLLRSSLVVVQVSLALVSLVGAMLFVQSFKNLQTSAVGFDTAPLLTLRFYLMGDSYEAPDARARRVEDIVRRVEAVPGIERAFGSNLIPLWSGGGGGRVEIDGRAAPPGEEPSIAFAGVTPGFHRTLGVAMAEGRDFTDAEGWSAERVAIVNRTMADRFWPGRSALGGRFRLLDSTGPQDVFTVIGVAPDVKHDDIDAEDESFPSAYAPYRFQQTVSTGLVIRVAGDPVSVSSAVREAIRASDPMIPVAQVRTMDELRELGYWEYGLFGWIFGVTGIVGLLLASVGVYGVLSYAVSQRTAEIGVRVALGAAHPDVLRLVVGHGLALSGAGVVVGLVLAPIGTRFGQTLFFNVSPFDPATFASVALFLLAVATVASYVPARRALRVDPVAALRGE